MFLYLPNLYQLTIGVGNGPAGPCGRPARSFQGRPNRFRGRYVHGMRLAASSCKGFMCINACGRVAGLAGRIIDLYGSRTLGMCRVAGWIRRLSN